MRSFFQTTILGLIILAFAAPGPASAAALKILSAGAVTKALNVLATDYQKTDQIGATIVYGNVGQIEDRLKADEIADIVILSAPALDQLERAGSVVPGTAVALGRVGMGLAVKAGAAVPDIATPQSFKAALLAAPSIAYSDPAGGGSSGIFFDKLIARLGIADAVRKKAVLIRGGSAADQVASGRAAMAVQNLSELIDVPGVRLVGPFPSADQNYLSYSGGVLARSPQPQAAIAFLRFIKRPAANAAWNAAGIAPAHGP